MWQLWLCNSWLVQLIWSNVMESTLNLAVHRGLVTLDNKPFFYCLQWNSYLVLTAPFNSIQILKFKAHPTNAFFRYRQSNFLLLLTASTTANYCLVVWTVLNDLITKCSAVVRSWEEPQNIWLMALKTAFLSLVLNFGESACYWKAQCN